LQCVAVCCSVLQCVAVCCSEFVREVMSQSLMNDLTALAHSLMTSLPLSRGLRRERHTRTHTLMNGPTERTTLATERKRERDREKDTDTNDVSARIALAMETCSEVVEERLSRAHMHMCTYMSARIAFARRLHRHEYIYLYICVYIHMYLHICSCALLH